MNKLLAFVLLSGVAVCAQMTPKASGPAVRPEDEIRQMTERWLAAAHSGDSTVLDAIEADEFIATTPGGDVVTKNELMPEPGSSNVLPRLSVKESTVRVYGDTAVLMAHLAGEPGGAQLSATNVFVRRNGQWRLVAAQLSPRMQRD